METFISPQLALLIVGVISIMLLSFGFFVGKKINKSSNDFLYAGRNVGLALSTATLIAAWVTGNTTMSAPEQGYTIGIIACFGYATAGLSLCIFAPLALRIKKVMPNGCTSGDFIRCRYGRPVWIVFLAISAWYFTAFLMTQAMAGGVLLQALSGLEYHIGMMLIMIVCTIYTLKGGLKAILSTDFVMAMLILIMLLVTAVLAFVKFGPTGVGKTELAKSLADEQKKDEISICWVFIFTHIADGLPTIHGLHIPHNLRSPCIPWATPILTHQHDPGI